MRKARGVSRRVGPVNLRETRREVSLLVRFASDFAVLCATIVVISLMNRIFLTRRSCSPFCSSTTGATGGESFCAILLVI